MVKKGTKRSSSTRGQSVTGRGQGHFRRGNGTLHDFQLSIIHSCYTSSSTIDIPCRMCNTCLFQLGPRLLLLDDRLSPRLCGGAAPASSCLTPGAPLALFVHGHRGRVGRWHEDGGETERGVGGKGRSLVQVYRAGAALVPLYSLAFGLRSSKGSLSSLCFFLRLSVHRRPRPRYVRQESLL